MHAFAPLSLVTCMIVLFNGTVAVLTCNTQTVHILDCSSYYLDFDEKGDMRCLWAYMTAKCLWPFMHQA